MLNLFNKISHNW